MEEHAARFEGIELARDRDKKAMESWREHPYVDIVDNRKSRDFDGKVENTNPNQSLKASEIPI